jgi:hypothetical protein
MHVDLNVNSYEDAFGWFPHLATGDCGGGLIVAQLKA